MNKKSLIAIIVFLLFVIAIILFNQQDKKDDVSVKLEETEEELKQVEEELKQIKEKHNALKDEAIAMEEENIDLKWEASNIVGENNRLTASFLEMSISSAIVTDVEISGGLMDLDMIYVTREGNKLVQIDQEFTNQITKDVPIFMLDEHHNFYKEDWDSMVNFDRTPLVEIFEDNFGRALFIRETDRDHDYDFEDL